MCTTGGNWAFVGAKCVKSAAVAQKFIDAGMIIIAKANLTVSYYVTIVDIANMVQEFAGLK
jgi:Asp-tRNA(Asn)/Glu-tRNA(Gln) amidotransferase A subunit family amidase